MTINGLGTLVVVAVLVWRGAHGLYGRSAPRHWPSRLLRLAGMGIICPMLVYDVFVGIDISRYPDELAAGILGIGLWLLGWAWAAERRWEVRLNLFGPDANIDSTTIAENPNWVREQVLGRVMETRWELLLPLVDAGWNGGFAWLTPELVREQIAKRPALPDDTSA